ncbi:MMPL family transporter [Cryptosporangium sp. NPDC051539]|uniref:MMPL family transporter n=1 Tax=Cryptosporangium sp. NPDC051539 TaxID=3363962 RepID=UPI0037AD2CA0
MKIADRYRPWAVVVLWIALLAAVWPLASHLGTVTVDRATDYLPSSAESTEVAAWKDSLPDPPDEDLQVVYHRSGGVTAADRAAAGRHLATLTAQFSSAAGSPPTVQISKDGTAMALSVPIDRKGDGVVAAARAAVDDRPAGLTVAVTGPAALGADLDAVFDGIDGTLLLITGLVVAALLILTYRSPVLWLVPLVSVGAAALLSRAVVDVLARTAGVTVNQQSAGILTVLVFGVATDYALLLVARYREELGRHERVSAAMGAALRRTLPAVIASAATVSAGLLCLLAADLNNTRGLGPVGVAGVLSALLAMSTLFPALLVLLGRRVFWPRIPAPGTPVPQARRWTALGRGLARRPVPAAVGSTVLLGVLAAGLVTSLGPLTEADRFTQRPESVSGYALLAAHFPDRAGRPLSVLTTPDAAAEVIAALRTTPGIVRVVPGATGGGRAEVLAFPSAAAGSDGESAAVGRVRAVVHRQDPHAAVGGAAAEDRDTDDAAARDERVVIPLVLAVVLVILGLLLRAVVAPVVLVASVVLSYAAALGGASFAFAHFFHFGGREATVPLLGFLFLVALGVDYTIFLMTRAREESAVRGTPLGIQHALAGTGGVITSAGLVLAATFAVLGTLPLVFMVELGVLVAFGVLLDTFLVRSVLVPAVVLLAGPRIWWPARVAVAAPLVDDRR